MAVEHLTRANVDGTTFGQANSEKVGFHGVAVAQAAFTTPPASTSATSSTPFGYTTAGQANAIVTWIIAVDTALKNKGIIAAS